MAKVRKKRPDMNVRKSLRCQTAYALFLISGFSVIAYGKVPDILKPDFKPEHKENKLIDRDATI